jgi:hypothetical protein
MKYLSTHTAYFLTIALCHSLALHPQQRTPIYNSAIIKKKERAENAQIVIANIAQMIGQIGYIIEKPHNADNVGDAVTNIVNNIVKITINAIQNKSIEIDDAHAIFNALEYACKDLDNTIVDMISLKKLQLYSLEE